MNIRPRVFRRFLGPSPQGSQASGSQAATAAPRPQPWAQAPSKSSETLQNTPDAEARRAPRAASGALKPQVWPEARVLRLTTPRGPRGCEVQTPSPRVAACCLNSALEFGV